MKLSAFIVPALSSLLLVAACGGSTPPAEPPPPPSAEPAPPPPPPPPPSAEPAPSAEAAPAPEPPKPIEATIKGAKKSKLTGTVTLTQEDDGVKVVVSVENAKPGEHATHIHEKADCSAADFKSAGGHLNPDNMPHGLPTAEKHHLGDLGNMKVGKDGKGTLEIVVKGANLKPGDAHSFLDRAIIVHANKDNGKPPMGGAGGRIGCGEIKAE